MAKVIRSSNPEIDGCLEMEDLKPGECECGALPDVHMRESAGCEFENHHCDMCHGLGICTTKECRHERERNQGQGGP